MHHYQYIGFFVKYVRQQVWTFLFQEISVNKGSGYDNSFEISRKKDICALCWSLELSDRYQVLIHP